MPKSIKFGAVVLNIVRRGGGSKMGGKSGEERWVAAGLRGLLKSAQPCGATAGSARARAGLVGR